jgi:ABC-type lipopolysaccharide export system ATPase subunit
LEKPVVFTFGVQERHGDDMSVENSASYLLNYMSQKTVIFRFTAVTSYLTAVTKSLNEKETSQHCVHDRSLVAVTI